MTRPSARMTYVGLEAGVERRQEGMTRRQRQDSLLRHGAVDVIVLNYHIFLENFHRKHFVTAFFLRQHHLNHTQQYQVSISNNKQTSVAGI